MPALFGSRKRGIRALKRARKRFKKLSDNEAQQILAQIQLMLSCWKKKEEKRHDSKSRTTTRRAKKKINLPYEEDQQPTEQQFTYNKSNTDTIGIAPVRINLVKPSSTPEELYSIEDIQELGASGLISSWAKGLLGLFSNKEEIEPAAPVHKNAPHAFKKNPSLPNPTQLHCKI